MSDLAHVTSASGPVGTVRIAGRPYPVHVVSMLAMGRLQRVVNGLSNPRPFSVTKAKLDAQLADGSIPKDQHAYELGRARAEDAAWPPEAITDSRFMALTLNDPDCQRIVIEEGLKLPAAEVAALVPAISAATYVKLWGMAMAEEPDPKDDGAVPADRPPPGTEAGSSAT